MDLLDASWKVLLLRGILGAVFGVIALAWPISTVVALAVLWGIWALVDGIGLAAQAFTEGTTGQRVFAGVMAVVALLAGLYAIFHPGYTAALLTWLLGIWLIVRGVFELVGAFAPDLGPARWMLVVGAAVDFLLGVLFVTHPGKSAVGITVLLGVVALIWGVVLVVLAFVARSQAHHLAHPTGSPA